MLPLGQYGYVTMEDSSDQTIYFLVNHDCVVSFDKTSGLLTGYSMGDNQYMAEGSTLKPSFYRAPTDNDEGAGLQRKWQAWRDPEMKLTSLSYEVINARGHVVAKYDLPSVKCDLTMEYTIDVDGKVYISQKLDPRSSEKDMPELFRFGLQMEMPVAYSQIHYYGRGPIETYPDRKANAFIGWYDLAVSDAYFSYDRPQESGLHSDLRYWSVINERGEGLGFVSGKDFYASALPYSTTQLEDFPEKAQRHSEQLIPSKDRVFLHLDAEHLGGRVILHFGAADYRTTVYVNGRECGSHRGGYVSFSFDITDFVSAGANTVTVNVTDDTRDRLIPSGKQSGRRESFGCYYTRTTGIWQTVWLEFAPQSRIVGVKYFAQPENALLTVCAKLEGEGTLRAQAFYEGRFVGDASVRALVGNAVLTLALSEKHLWEIGEGRLYDLILTFGDDSVKSYFGLRSVGFDGHRFLLNGKSVFQRLVLDQGFYPDGIYTAPSDGELAADVERAAAMGFNGARLHEKVFEERFLYHCDRMGYMVWGEYPNWGLDHTYADSIYSVLPEWLDEVERDFNHPSIIGWCPFNETWDIDGRRQCDEMIASVYRATKAADPTRPCIDTSGSVHVMTDVYDIHDYEQDPNTLAEHYALLGEGRVADIPTAFSDLQSYDGKKPFFVSEYGGIAWTDDKSGWGYGNAPDSAREFTDRLEGLTNALLKNKYIFGFCYTQLTDIEQEQNGLYTYDRKPKFPCEEIRRIISAAAAIED